MNEGYILLHRQAIDSTIWNKPPLYWKVWSYLLFKAQHSDYKQLKRGQLFISIPDIIEALKYKVGARTERHTKDQIFQVIEFLRKPNEGGNESNAKATMITTTKATHGMVITILNYNELQSNTKIESNGESNSGKPTKPARKQRQPDNINKECFINENNEIFDIASNNQIVDAVIAHLNEKAERSFKPTTQAYRKEISARLKEGYQAEDFFEVIDFKVLQWKHDHKFSQYLQPSTLFCQSHFDEYLQAAKSRTIIAHKPLQVVR